VVALEVPGGTTPTISLSCWTSRQCAAGGESLDPPMILSHTTLGVATVDVLDVKGAVILDVEAGKPGAAAGLKAGEVIESLDGQAVTSVSDFESRLGGHQPGPCDPPRCGPPAEPPVASRRVCRWSPCWLRAPTGSCPPTPWCAAPIAAGIRHGSGGVGRDAAQPRRRAAQAGDGAGRRTSRQSHASCRQWGLGGTVAFLRGQASELAGDRAGAVQAYRRPARLTGASLPTGRW